MHHKSKEQTLGNMISIRRSLLLISFASACTQYRPSRRRKRYLQSCKERTPATELYILRSPDADVHINFDDLWESDAKRIEPLPDERALFLCSRIGNMFVTGEYLENYFLWEQCSHIRRSFLNNVVLICHHSSEIAK